MHTRMPEPDNVEIDCIALKCCTSSYITATRNRLSERCRPKLPISIASGTGPAKSLPPKKKGVVRGRWAGQKFNSLLLKQPEGFT